MSHGFTGTGRVPAIDLSIIESVNAGNGDDDATDGNTENVYAGITEDEPASDIISSEEDYHEISSDIPAQEKIIADEILTPEPVEPDPEIIPDEVPVDTSKVASFEEKTIEVFEDPSPSDVSKEEMIIPHTENSSVPPSLKAHIYQASAVSDQLLEGITPDPDKFGPGSGKAADQLSTGSGETGEEISTGGYYLKMNYNQVRDLLGNSLVYPKIARKMGWAGEVHVSFLLKMDGTVSEISVEKSCGFPVLDKSAVKTIENASPFPIPETEVRIMIPIAYNLD